MRLRVAPILAALALGCVTCVGVAWGFAIFASDPEPRPSDQVWKNPADGGWFSWVTRRNLACSRTTIFAERLFKEDATAVEFYGEMDQRSWMRIHFTPGAPQLQWTPRHKPNLVYEEFTCGYPMACLWASQTSDQYGDILTFEEPLHVLQLWPTAGINLFLCEAGRVLMLPTGPIWKGLLGNVALYSACWYGAGWLGAATVRSRRRGRGRCPSCGYSRSGLDAAAVCPECGAADGQRRSYPSGIERGPNRTGTAAKP